MAEYLGISQQSYSNYERNAREIPAAHAVKLPHPLADYGPCPGPDMLPAEVETLICLQNMDEKNRQAFLRFLSYLCTAQEKGL